MNLRTALDTSETPLGRWLDALDDREQCILKHRIESHRPTKTLAAIGKAYEISSERVRTPGQRLQIWYMQAIDLERKIESGS